MYLRYYGREEIDKRQSIFEASKGEPRGAARANNEHHLSGNYGNPDSIDDFGCSG
jgi:hypothetical protein